MCIYQFAKLASNNEMKTIDEIRRSNLKLLKKEFGTYADIAERAGTSAAYLSQIISPNNPRNMGDELARNIEVACKKQIGWMDQFHNTIQEEASEACIEGQLDGITGNIKAAAHPPANNVEPGPDTRGFVPLISWVQAGDWCDAVVPYEPHSAENWLPCPVSHGPNTYALRVKGDSMTAPHPGMRSYPEGTIIYVDPGRPITNGCRIIARQPFSNEVTFKEYREDGGKRYLKPINPQYQMQEIGEDTRLCGVVIGQFIEE